MIEMLVYLTYILIQL